MLEAGTVSADDGLRARRGRRRRHTHARHARALISARTAMSHFLISDEIGKPQLR